ncbi:CYTH domain-containing protein [Candidatus Neomarinimicrobiota bacterium]
MRETEIESKLEISEVDFGKVINMCEVIDSVELLNVYYDEHEILSNESATFRIRLSSCKEPTITLKLPIKNRKIRREAVEINKNMHKNRYMVPHIRYDVRNELPKEINKYLVKRGIEHLHRLGWIRVHRFQLRVHDDGPYFEMDMVKFPDGQLYYEVEIEGAEATKHHQIIRYIKSIASSAEPSPYNKYQRFSKSLKRTAASALKHTSA